MTNGRAYYNEHDPYCAAWLRNLIAAGHIADGDVDERSIEDVCPRDLRGYTQCHFFAGIGVWSYALRLAGWDDSRPVWTGSCPCQPFSAAGKGGGFADERHLWPAWFHLISQCRPGIVFGEQVANDGGLDWIDLVHADMEGANYAFGEKDLCAASIGAPNIRQRLFWVADAQSEGGWRGPTLAQRYCAQPGGPSADIRPYAWPDGFGSGSNEPICNVLSPSYGDSGRVGRLRAYGNAINAEAAAAFIRAYLEGDVTEAA